MDSKKELQNSITDKIPMLTCGEEGKLVGGFSVLSSQESEEPGLNVNCKNCSIFCNLNIYNCTTTQDTTEDTTQDPGQDPLIANSLLM